MEPLKITFTFVAPVTIDSEYPKHLDALLAAGVEKDARAMGHEDPWAASHDLSDCLARTEGKEWVWKASMLVFSPLSGLQFQNMTRKSEPDRFFGDLGIYWQGNKPTEEKPLGINPETFKIDTRSGQQRGYQWLSAYQWMEKAEAWAVGDKDAIEHYLSKLEYVGKVGRNGYGRIKNFSVVISDETENWRLRNLPLDEPGLDGIRYEPVHANIRSCYWKSMNRIISKEPLI